MQLSVKGKQLDVGDALRTHVDESLSRILGKYFGNALEVTVTLSRDAYLYRAVLSAHVGRGIQLDAHGEANEYYPDFDVEDDRRSQISEERGLGNKCVLMSSYRGYQYT